MKKIYLFPSCIFLYFIATGQISPNSQWTWIKGDSSINKPGNYGTKGVSNTTNKPGGRKGGITWKDNEGNLWLYGGYGYAKNATVGMLNDIWKFSPQNNEWAWMHGADTINAPIAFGNFGVSNSTNTPGGLSNGSPSWRDNDGNLWVMGSSATLWKYTVQTNEWIWVKGDSATSPASANWSKYGTKGIPDINNEPGSTGPMFWTDKNGNFWMYKTFGFTSAGSGSMNDLWQYSPSSNMWTWVDGDSVLHANGRSVYGTKGVADDNNYPGSRSQVVTWADQNDNLWAFGGYGLAWAPQLNNFTNFYLSDLWKYSISTKKWMWVSGDSTTGNAGANHFSVYGTQGQAAPTNKPGIRGDASGVSDNQGNLWLFHGWGSSSNAATEMLNDYWKYDPSSNHWTWVKGDVTGNKLSVYGTLGIANTTNKPGGRWDLSTWMDGNIWVFGGEGYGASGGLGLLNDLWKVSNVYTFIGNGAWPFSGNWLNNHAPPNTISGSMTVIIDPQTGAQCDLANSLTIQPGGTLTIKSSVLNVAQNLDNEGFINGSGALRFECRVCGPLDTAVVPVVLSSTGSLKVPVSFVHRYVYLTNHTKTLSIDLQAGSKIRLDSFNLDMDSSSLTGFDGQNFIITNNTGKLIRSVGTSDVVFPVGTDSLSYTPVTVGKMFSSMRITAATNVDFGVGVRNGVQVGANILTKGVVNRTWLITRSDTSAFRIGASWNVGDELSGFDRNNSHIALVCPPPDNCVAGFDVITPSGASGSGPFTLSRVGPFQSNASSFIIRTTPVRFEFNGTVNTEWSNAANWIDGLIAPTTVINGVEIFINNDCNYTGTITLQGGKLTVRPGKKLNVAQ